MKDKIPLVCGRIPIALGLVAITRRQEHGVGAVDVRQGGVKQAPGFILAGRGLDAYRSEYLGYGPALLGFSKTCGSFLKWGYPYKSSH